MASNNHVSKWSLPKISEIHCITYIFFSDNPNNNSDCLKTLKYLLDHNANMEAKSAIGRTVLHFASESSLLEVVQFLVEEKQTGKVESADRII